MLFHFSATGNSQWVAESLSKALGERLCNIASSEAMSCIETIADDEPIGFCFPVHGWRTPRVVRDFVSRLRVSNPQMRYCYVVLTVGDSAGETVERFSYELKSSGLYIASAFTLVMPESYIGLPFMDVDTKARERKKIDKAAEMLERIAHCVKTREKGVYEVERGYFPRLYSRVIGAYFENHLITDKRFRVNPDTCMGCGKCVSACQVDNMAMSDEGMPQWLHTGRCLTCFACYHLCPQHAIDFWHFTSKKGQYHFSRTERYRKG